MARIIEFRIPDTYQPKDQPAVVSITRGKVIEFPNDSNPAIRRIQLFRDCSVLSRVIGAEKNLKSMTFRPSLFHSVPKD